MSLPPKKNDYLFLLQLIYFEEVVPSQSCRDHFSIRNLFFRKLTKGLNKLFDVNELEFPGKQNCI